jgi:prolyl 4-hydroxylase
VSTVVIVAAGAALALIVAVRVLSTWRARRRYAIRELPGFLSDAECDHLIERARPLLRQSAIVDQGQRGVIDTQRSSGSAFLDQSGDPVLQEIKRRIAEITDTRVDQQERIQVTHYHPRESYAPHFDALGASGLDTGEAGDRIWTVIIYLNDDFAGGETVFPRIARRVRPEKGKALVFTNLMPDAARHDPLSLHAGARVREGEKWLSNQWIRQHRRHPVTTGAQRGGRNKRASERRR